MSQLEQSASGIYDKDMSTSKNSSTLRLNQEGAVGQERDWMDHDTDSEISEHDFLTKGAFLLTPSHELTVEKAATICDKMNFRGAFSLTKTATGILFKFSNIDDFQAVYKKGFHKVTGARFYKKVAIPCRPAKIFTVYVLDVPEELPEDDIRHALYKYRSIVEVTRLPLNTATVLKAINDKLKSENSNEPPTIYTGPPVIRVTLASVEETSMLLSRGLDFYGATFFPTETPHPISANLAKYKNNSCSNDRWLELASLGAGQRVRDLLPVFDNAGFTKLPPPASRVIKPQRN
ncbi:uncharacterized protein LOC123269853 isoform X1 [Cotesia glomerata]|uniref:Uncharacterized protein n=1 Tax=Cotesia glomerata TaxID=32391 RepID=A0AAV7I781_COTGL|nr:uncharacterized protein LOC123269853 isoform X1 [Cotesia glomerata]KAH0547084.1 hypothetical protein KQX54_017010 [Cotesia glomerata]